MADEILQRDQNRVTVLGGVTDDADTDIEMLRVHPISKRLLVSADISGAAVTSINGLTGAITLAAGTNITLGTIGNTITINASSSGTVTGTGTAGTLAYWNTTTSIASVTAGTGITFSAPTISVTANSTVQKVEITKNSGAVVGTRKQLNFIEGSNVTLTVADDGGNDQVDITIASSGGASGIVVGTTTITSGTNTRIPFNDSGVYQEDPNLSWNKTTDALTINTAIFSRPSSGTLYAGAFPASIVSPNNGTAFGMGAGAAITTAASYLCLGYLAGSTATTQLSFCYIGANAGLNAAGTRNFGAGASALANNSGTDCYGLGSLSMSNATGEVGSIFIGTNTGVTASTGFYQTFIGDASGAATGASWGNTHVGARGGQTVGTGGFGSSRNSSFGYTADVAAGITSAMALGAGAVAITSNTVVIGGTITRADVVYFGKGESDAAPTVTKLQATNAIGGTTTNGIGADFELGGGRGTGTGTPGYINFYTSASTGSSGTTLQTHTKRARMTDTVFESLTSESFSMPFAAGSATAPTYSFVGDTNTGIYSDVADKLKFTTGGTLRTTLSSDGTIHTVRNQQSKGANVAAANDLTLGRDGNTFVITGNTTINAILTTDWQAGSQLVLIFTGTPTVKHNTAGGAGTAVLFLAGSVDLTAANNTVLTLVYDGTQFQEMARKVA